MARCSISVETRFNAEAATSNGTGIRKVRVIVEFVVIVGSILVAFALDAWWSARNQAQHERAQLQTLHDEFTRAELDLTTLRERLEGLRVAVAALLPHISPNAPNLSLDSLNALMDLSFRLGTVELKTGSVQALLASGELATIRDSELKALIAAWPAEVARLRGHSAMLENNRELILEYLHAKIPTLDITQKTGQMDRYPSSSFVGRSSVLQTDMRVEGLFGNRGMMIEDADRIVVELAAQATRAIRLIRGQLSLN